MTDLLPIREVTAEAINQVVRRALETGVDRDARGLADFIAAIDWSSVSEADPEVVSVLGTIEGALTDLSEGVTDAAEFAVILGRSLPAGEELRLTLGGVAITTRIDGALLTSVPGVGPAQSAGRPQSVLAIREPAPAL